MPVCAGGQSAVLHEEVRVIRRHGQRGEPGTAGKRVAFNLFHALREGNVAQFLTIRKSAVSNALECAGQRRAEEAGSFLILI